MRLFPVIRGAAIFGALMLFAGGATFAAKAPEWTSPDHYRVLMTVDGRGSVRSSSPVSVNLDFPQQLAGKKATGVFDENTIEVIAYNTAGKPRVFDPSRKGYEKYLLPWRIEKYYGVSRVTLSFAMPDDKCASYAVYFDTKQSGLGKPKRYAGIVGDGDFFRQGFGRKKIGANEHEDFGDLDGDGDLDLIKVTAEPFLYVYENTGHSRFVERGRMTSGGSLFVLGANKGRRAWPNITFADWDGDGDPDLFVTSSDGPDSGNAVVYENTTVRGGQINFVNRGRLLTQTGKPTADAWFATICPVDWDGDGKKDIIACRDKKIEFHKNIGTTKSLKDIKIADAEFVQANGQDLTPGSTRMECADIDNDGDLDMFLSTFNGPVFLYKNIGSSKAPRFGDFVELEAGCGGHAGVKVHDFDGDGLLDYVTSAAWEGAIKPGQPRRFARMFKNVGTKTSPKFEERDATNGAPFTEQFNACDGARQSGLRAADLNGDGKMDLVASTDSGSVLYFRNLANGRFPVFAPETVLISGMPQFDKLDVCDWNNDGKEDILLADGAGYVTLFLNQGTKTSPSFPNGTRLTVNGVDMKTTGRGSVLVCDWDLDGKKDVLTGMCGDAGATLNPDWPHADPADPTKDNGFLFFKNVGTDAEPVLAIPKWLETVSRGNRRVISSSVRPNLGSYTDWDGDGKKDFIFCDFENSIKLYANSGSGKPGEEPAFGFPVEGVTLIAPWSPQLVSSVDTLDWNRDGDTDIITGQGHAGTALRFYEHDFVQDTVSDSFPMVTVGLAEMKK